MKAVRICLVCGRDGAALHELAPGRRVLLCGECAVDRFRRDEALRRLAAKR